MADVFTSHRNTTEDKRVRGCAELLEVLRGSQGSSSTSGLFSVFSTGILYSMPWETRSPDKQTLFSVFSVRKTVFYISISLEQHSSPLTVTHDQTPLVATQSITAIIPRPCSTTGTCPSSKPHSDHDHDHGHCTSSPSLVIGTKNIWMDEKTLMVWQTHPRCLNFILNTSCLLMNFSALTIPTVWESVP